MPGLLNRFNNRYSGGKSGGGSGGVTEFNTRTGNVTLEASDVEGLFTAANEVFLGTGNGTGELVIPPGFILATHKFTSAETYSVATAMTALDTTNLTLAFIVPANGIVDVDVQCMTQLNITTTASAVWANLLNHTGGAALGDATCLGVNLVLNTDIAISNMIRFHLTGLTAGALQVDFAAEVQTAPGTAATLFTGTAGSSSLDTPFIIRAIASV